MKKLFPAIVALILVFAAVPAQQVLAAPPSLIPYITGLAIGEEAGGAVVLDEIAVCGARDGHSEWSVTGKFEGKTGTFEAIEKGTFSAPIVMSASIADGPTLDGAVRMVTIDAASDGWGFISVVIADGKGTVPIIFVCTTG